MSVPVTVYGGARFSDDTENLSIAKLNAAGSPIMKVIPNSIGSDELIDADVLDILNTAQFGVRVEYVFPADYSVLHALGALQIATVDAPVARVNDPLTVVQMQDANILLTAQALNGTIALFGWGIDAAHTIPAGTTITVIVFTSHRILPVPGDPPPTPETDTTGWITVTPGYAWQTGEAISTPKLDRTCHPSGLIADNSIGKRELIAADVIAIAAPAISGQLFSGQITQRLSILPFGHAIAMFTITGATVGQIPEMYYAQPFLFTAVVTAPNTIFVSIANLSSTTKVINAGTVVTGRLI